MKLVFAGTPEFAVPSLESLVGAGHSVALVITRPDRRRGRGQKPGETPVKRAALKLGLPLMQPQSINEPQCLARMRRTGAELGVLVAYGEILNRGVLSAPAQGFVNLHASLLPSYRGAAPIHRAIIRGESQTGVTVLKMSEKLDAGPILAQKAVPIGPDQTTGELHDVLKVAGAQLLTDVVNRLDRGERHTEREQDASRASYAPGLTKEDSRIDWTVCAGAIRNRVRGLTPWPGAYCQFAGRKRSERVALLEVEAVAELSTSASAEPGTVLSVEPDESVLVKAGQGAVRIKAVKPASGRAMAIADFVHGHGVVPGDRFC